MPLDKTTLKNTIKTIMTDMRAKHEVSDDEFATRLSDAIEVFVKSGDGMYQPGKLTAGTTTVTAVGVGAAVKIQ